MINLFLVFRWWREYAMFTSSIIFRMKPTAHQWNPFTIPIFYFSLSKPFRMASSCLHTWHTPRIHIRIVFESIATIWIQQYFVHFDSNAYLRYSNRMSNAREPKLDNLMAIVNIAVCKDGYGLFRLPFATKCTTAISAQSHSHSSKWNISCEHYDSMGVG